MRRALTLIAFLVASAGAFSFTIPKKLMGQYEAEVPAFEFENNGRTVKASAYTISLVLKEEYLWYKSGIFKFYGSYKNVTESADFVDVDVEVSNEISVSFDIELQISKHGGSVSLKGLEGIPDLTLKKHDIQVTEKNGKGFKRL